MRLTYLARAYRSLSNQALGRRGKHAPRQPGRPRPSLASATWTRSWRMAAYLYGLSSRTPRGLHDVCVLLRVCVIGIASPPDDS